MREPIFQPRAGLKLLILAALIAFVSVGWYVGTTMLQALARSAGLLQ